MTDLADALADSLWYARQPPELRQALAREGRVVALGPGQWVHGEGDERGGITAVLSGRVRLMVAVGREREALIDILGPGTVFGQSGRFGGGPRLVTAIAVGPARIFHIADAGLQAVAACTPQVWRAVSELLYGQLAGSVRLAAEALCLPPRERLAARLVALRRTAGRGADGRLDVSQAELAELTGLSRKLVNELLGVWRRAGLVETGYGVVRLVDPERLAAIADVEA